jgi:transposase
MSEAMTSTDYSGRVQMKRAYKLRAYPTRSQEGRAARLLADHCDLYNAALEKRREAWRRHTVSVSYGTQPAQLRAIRAADPDGQGRHSFTAQQQTLRRLDVVFRAFYARAQAGGAGYPRKVRSRRRDFHHKTARTLVSGFDVIALEKLNTRAMTHRPAPRPDDAGAWLPNGAAAKAGLGSGHALMT